MTAEVISLTSDHTDEFEFLPVEHPRALLLSLVAGDRLIFRERECWPWAESGVAPSPPWGISGYTDATLPFILTTDSQKQTFGRSCAGMPVRLNIAFR